MIRSASAQDGHAMVAMAERFHAAVPQAARLPFSKMAAAQTFLACIDSHDFCALVLDLDGPKGALIAQVMRFPLSAEWVAKEIVFWIEPEHRAGRWAKAMISAYEHWARSKGAVMAGLSCFADGRTEKLFLRAGYRRAEVNTVKDL